jgi:hypothetical protein
MRSKLPLLLVLGSLALLTAGCGGSSTTTAAGDGSTMADTTTTGTTSTMAMGGDKPCEGYGSTKIGGYTVLVAIEDHAPILSKADASTSTDAETHIIADGADGAGIDNAESADKHVEVHICDTASGAPAQHLTPTVTIKDNTDGTAAAPLAVTESYGKGDDPMNVHYGNNVAFPAGHQAEVTVGMDGQSGTFKIAVE